LNFYFSDIFGLIKIFVTAIWGTKTARMRMNFQLFLAITFHFGKMFPAIIAFKNKKLDLTVVFDLLIFRTDNFLSKHEPVNI